jgi:hypothetical protein
MTAPYVDVVIACHDESRPIERAVASVFADAEVRRDVRVTVVAHGLPAEPFRQRLSGMDGDVRVVSLVDGIRSAAGPFNHGLSLADGEYCAVMGSDDFLEPGALAAWIRHARAHRPDAVIAPLRIDGQTRMPNPLVRLGRRNRLDAAKDRLFYRTAPLGLIRTATMRAMGLRMVEGLPVGEDFEFSIRLFATSSRVDLPAAPCYVIGTDARERTTHAPLPAEDVLQPLVRLLDDGVVAGLAEPHRRALAVKLIRVSIVGIARGRDRGAWRDDAEVAFVAGVLRRLIAVAPRVLTPFNRQDRRVLDGLLREPTIDRVTADAARAASAGRRDRWLTPDVVHSLAREATLRRYLLYFLTRERKPRR